MLVAIVSIGTHGRHIVFLVVGVVTRWDFFSALCLERIECFYDPHLFFFRCDLRSLFGVVAYLAARLEAIFVSSAG